MTLLDQNWCNKNTSRRYPLDDNATGIGDDGTKIKDDIIADMNVRWPIEVGQYIFLSGLTVTRNVVSAVFLAADTPMASAGFVPLAAVTLPQPVERNRYYPLEAMYPGVGGFILFGDVTEDFTARFSTPSQGLIAPRVGMPYTGLTVSSIGKDGRNDALTGIVTLRAGTDIEIKADTALVEDDDLPVIVIKLVDPTTTRNVLSDYVGPCGGRPESESCLYNGIQTINGIQPDCNGDLRIVFRGLEATPFESCGSEAAGTVLDQSIGISDVCVGVFAPGRFSGEDDCEGQYVPVPSSSEGSESDSSSSSSSSGDSVSSESVSPVPLPFTDYFDDPSIHESWVLHRGAYRLVSGDAPGDSVGIDQSLQLYDGSRRNLIVWENDATDETWTKQVDTSIRLTNGMSYQNGGIILNYHRVDPLITNHLEYHVVQIDRNTNTLDILWFNGSIMVTEASVPLSMPLSLGAWYDLEVSSSQSGGGASLYVRMQQSSPTLGVPVELLHLATNWGEPDGYNGLHTNQAVTDFSFWRIDNA